MNLKEVTPEQISEAMELYPALWVKKHKIKNEIGTPIDFTKRRFLWDMYNDLSPFQVMLKPPQIGATVMNTLKSLYVAKKKNRQIIYTLPTQGDVQDMVGGSFNRIIAQNPILMDWVKDHDTIEQKTVGTSMIFYRGTFTQKQAMMIPSGLNIHDEVDASDASVITAYENRLQAQEDGGWRWYFSHPSLKGHGVDVYWEQSDKKEWFIKCNKCNEKQILSWPESIDLPSERYVCKHCRAVIEDSERINGEWRKTSTGDFSGYHVSQLMLYNKSAKDIIKAFNDPLKDKQYFYNYVLGLPYVSSDDRIDPSVVLRNCVDQVNEQEGRIIMGVDTGHGIHMVAGNKNGIFYYDNFTEISASHDPYDELRKLLRRWPKSIVISDQGGDLIGIRKLQAEFPGRVFLVYYRKDRKTVEIVQWGDDEEYGKVQVDRNRMMTLVVEQMRDTGRYTLNGTKEEFEEFASHFGYLYREKILTKETKDKDDSSLYGAQYVWKRNGPDHYAHATLYMTVGLQRYGGELAKIIGESILGNLPKGQIVQPQGIASFVSPAEFSEGNKWTA